MNVFGWDNFNLCNTVTKGVNKTAGEGCRTETQEEEADTSWEDHMQQLASCPSDSG